MRQVPPCIYWKSQRAKETLAGASSCGSRTEKTTRPCGLASRLESHCGSRWVSFLAQPPCGGSSSRTMWTDFTLSRIPGESAAVHPSSSITDKSAGPLTSLCMAWAAPLAALISGQALNEIMDMLPNRPKGETPVTRAATSSTETTCACFSTPWAAVYRTLGAPVGW